MMTAAQQLLCHSLLLRRFARDEICAHFCAYLTDFQKYSARIFFILQLKFTQQMMLSHFQIIRQVVLTLVKCVQLYDAAGMQTLLNVKSVMKCVLRK